MTVQDSRHQCRCTFGQMWLLSHIRMPLHFFVWPYHLHLSFGHYCLVHQIKIRTTNILKLKVEIIIARRLVLADIQVIHFLLRTILKQEMICCLCCQTLLLSVSQASEVKQEILKLKGTSQLIVYADGISCWVTTCAVVTVHLGSIRCC
jgi:hypothetical protein